MRQQCISVHPRQWKQFQAATAAKNISASSCLRLLIGEFLRKEAREAGRDVAA